jgi:hypothetical protein
MFVLFCTPLSLAGPALRADPYDDIQLTLIDTGPTIEARYQREFDADPDMKMVANFIKVYDKKLGHWISRKRKITYRAHH